VQVADRRGQLAQTATERSGNTEKLTLIEARQQLGDKRAMSARLAASNCTVRAISHVIMGRHPKTFTTGDRKMSICLLCSLYWNANSRLAGGMHDLALFSA
jgi:hypothetical protein